MDDTYHPHGHYSADTLPPKHGGPASSQADVPATGLGHDGGTTSAQKDVVVTTKHPEPIEVEIERLTIHGGGASEPPTDSFAAGETPTPYAYEALDEAAQEIRLLTILPGDFSSEARVCLHTVSFSASKNSSLEFEALSYAWGNQDDPRDLLMGKSGTQTIKITQNLAEAMPYLRYIDKPRIIWIDAICVNQQDPVERSSQVRRMADIYSLASQVVIWLGPAAEDTALAVEGCKVVSENIIVDWSRFTMTPRPHSQLPEWADNITPPLWSPEQETAVIRLLKRSWFYRLWIWQEVALASATLVMCGSHYLTWGEIQVTVFAYSDKPKTAVGINFVGVQEYLLNLCRRSSLEFDSQFLLSSTRQALCSDPRDKLFALFSLFRSYDQHVAIEVDYTKPPSQIYIEFARKYIKTKNSLSISSHVEMVPNAPAAQRPTWVPNWSSARQTYPLSYFNASGLSIPLVNFEDGGSIMVTGCKVGTIDCLEYMGELPLENYEDNVLKFSKFLKKSKDLFGLKSDDTRSLCRVLCGGVLSECYWPPRKVLSSLQDAEGRIQQIWEHGGDDSELLAGLERYGIILNSMLSACRHRSLIRCSNGALGLAPAAALSGDIVVVWLGCDNPMVLRPSRNGGGSYFLVGEAYCDGSMVGEALLGQLPQDIESVRVYDEGTATEPWSYIDRRSNEITGEDPRLSDIPLPEPWKIEPYQNLPYFKNDETGEWTWNDPRMSREELEKRGVKLEVFEVE